MTVGLKTGRSIQEFWIDFLLEEEFGCDPAFAARFAKACELDLDEAGPIAVHHSVGDQFGEADLVVLFKLKKTTSSAALLIENKITAAFQPKQAERYRMRGDHGIAEGAWHTYRTVLVAPERYIQPGSGFDHSISLECLGEWISQFDPARRSFKIARLLRAIDKKNSTGVQIVDAAMTSFRDWYRGRMIAFGAGFIPPTPRPAYWGDNWIEWTSERIPHGWRFRHRSLHGVLDLCHADFTVELFEQLQGKLPPGSTFCRVGKKRGGVAVAVDPITDVSDVEHAEPIVKQVLSTASDWQQVLSEHSPEFMRKPMSLEKQLNDAPLTS